MRKQRVFFVATTPPFAYGGGAQATRAYLDATLDFYGRENVTVMLFDGVEIPEEYKDLRFVKVPELPKYKQLFLLFKGYLSRMTPAILNFMNIYHKDFDICVINGGTIGGRVVKVLEKMGVRTIVIHHNYEVEFYRDNKAKGTFGGKFMRLVRNSERLSYKNATLNLYLTNQDVDLLKNEYGKNLGKNIVIGTFDYKEREKEQFVSTPKQFDFAISGSLVNYQTMVGILDFYNKYLPIAKQTIPNLKVLLTGRNPSAEIMKIQESNPETISIIANPRDILPIIQQGKIYLCPICIGGGLKLRAMDGLKCGMPILVHEVSARGYDYYFKKPYFRVYNDERSFEKGLRELVKYLERNPDCSNIINRDYYEFFGYNQGYNRFKNAMQFL